MDALVRLNAWNRCAAQRRLLPLGRVVAAVAEITADQPAKPAAQAALFLEHLGGGYCLLDKVLVFARAVRRLRRAFLPNHGNEFYALLAQNALHAANGVALAV
jgi:hypothetical protein